MADDRNVRSLDTRGAILSGDLRKTVFVLALPVLGECELQNVPRCGRWMALVGCLL